MTQDNLDPDHFNIYIYIYIFYIFIFLYQLINKYLKKLKLFCISSQNFK